MKSQLYNILKEQSTLTFEQIIGNIIFAAIIGLAIFISYAISHRGTIYSRKFNVSLVVLTVLTSMVMTVIGNNVALSLGMVGALSIVRFRTAIKDSRDTVYIFWTIIVGICCGVGDYLVASIGSSVVFVILMILGSIKNNSRMLVIIRAKRNMEQKVQSVIFNFFHGKASLRVKNSTEETAEFIYEITEKLLKHAEKENNQVLSDEIYKIEGIEYVNIVMQNDEVSN